MDLALPAPSEGSEAAAARVAEARQAQAERFEGAGSDTRRPLNADAPVPELDRIAAPDAAGNALLADAAARLSLTARAYHRVLKVARTIADLDGSDGVRRIYLAEALSYRRRLPGSEDSPARASLAR